jgi:hypothetical protein
MMANLTDIDAVKAQQDPTSKSPPSIPFQQPAGQSREIFLSEDPSSIATLPAKKSENFQGRVVEVATEHMTSKRMPLLKSKMAS